MGVGRVSYRAKGWWFRVGDPRIGKVMNP